MTTAEKTSEKPLSGAQGKGGQRLAAAFDAVGRMPALEETVDRVVKVASQESSSLTEITELVETDTAMAIAVMKSANNGGGPRGRIANVPDAVEALTPAGDPRRRRLAADLRPLPALDLLGASFPSASAATPSRLGTPPRASPTSPRSRAATSSRPRRCSTTSASSS